MGISTADLIQRYRDGWTTTALGEWYGVSPSTIRNRLIAAGVTMRPRGKPRRTAPDAIDLVIMQRVAEGVGKREIGRQLGMTHQAVRQRIRKLEEMEVYL